MIICSLGKENKKKIMGLKSCKQTKKRKQGEREKKKKKKTDGLE